MNLRKNALAERTRRRKTSPHLEPLEGRALLTVPPTAQFTAVDQVVIEEDYQVFLGRQADAPGLAAYESLLNAGVSPFAVAQDIAQSPEALTRYVNLSYRAILGAAPTSAQLSAGIAVIQQAGSLTALDTQLLSSPQFYANAGGTNQGYVSALYGTVLGRAGDPAGAAAWLSLLNRGVTRAAVASAFLTSPERITHQVNAAYGGILGRAADPAGLAAWAGLRESNTVSEETMLIDFINSSENLGIIGPIVANPSAGTAAQIASGLIVNAYFTPGVSVADFSVTPNGISWSANGTNSPSTITVVNRSTTQSLVFTPAIGLESFYPNQLPASAFTFLDMSGNPLTGPITVAPGQTASFQVEYDNTQVPVTEATFGNYGASVVLLNPYGRQLIPLVARQFGMLAGTVGMDLSFTTTLTSTLV